MVHQARSPAALGLGILAALVAGCGNSSPTEGVSSAGCPLRSELWETSCVPGVTDCGGVMKCISFCPTCGYKCQVPCSNSTECARVAAGHCDVPTSKGGDQVCSGKPSRCPSEANLAQMECGRAVGFGGAAPGIGDSCATAACAAGLQCLDGVCTTDCKSGADCDGIHWKSGSGCYNALGTANACVYLMHTEGRSVCLPRDSTDFGASCDRPGVCGLLGRRCELLSDINLRVNQSVCVK